MERICEAGRAPALKLVVHFSPELIEKAARAMGLDPLQTRIAPQLHPHDKRIEYLCLALASHVLRTYAVGATPPKNGLAQGRLHEVLDYIGQHLTHDLSVAELAAIAHCSPSHFKVLFKRSTGMPVHQYVIRARVERALDLLVEGDLPLSEIALQCGFASQSHLGVCFRLHYGKTPAELRRDVQ